MWRPKMDTKFDTLSTVASAAEMRAHIQRGVANDLTDVMENQAYCDFGQDFFRPIRNPWGRTYVAKLIALYNECAEKFEALADEAER